MPAHHANDPSAASAACNASIGQILNFLAIATTGAALGHWRFCVRMIATVRTFSRLTGQPAAQPIGRSDLLQTLHSI
jgi:hypothetical protein